VIQGAEETKAFQSPAARRVGEALRIFLGVALLGLPWVVPLVFAEFRRARAANKPPNPPAPRNGGPP